MVSGLSSQEIFVECMSEQKGGNETREFCVFPGQLMLVFLSQEAQLVKGHLPAMDRGSHDSSGTASLPKAWSFRAHSWGRHHLESLPLVTLLSKGPMLGCLLTQVHVSSPGVTLLVTLAAPQLHELYM